MRTKQQERKGVIVFTVILYTVLTILFLIG